MANVPIGQTIQRRALIEVNQSHVNRDPAIYVSDCACCPLLCEIHQIELKDEASLFCLGVRAPLLAAGAGSGSDNYQSPSH